MSWLHFIPSEDFSRQVPEEGRNTFSAKGGSLIGIEQKASHEQGDGQKNFSEEGKNG